MGCLFNSNIVECKEFQLGGIKQIFFANRTEVSGVLYDASDYERSTVLSYTPSAGLTGITWYEYQFDIGTLFYNGDRNSTLNGYNISKSITGDFQVMTALKRTILKQFMDARNAICVFVDNNGNIFSLGEERPLKVTKYNEATGALQLDKNRYNLSLTVTDNYILRSLDSSYFNANILPFAGIYVQPSAPVQACITEVEFQTWYLNQMLNVPISCTLYYHYS